MERDVLEKPILVIGAARSGTQLLTRILAAHPEIAYLDEPSYIWRRGKGRLAHEMYPPALADPGTIESIRADFRRLCLEREGSRIVEKTPANTLRLGYVLSVLPDARILHLVRDGRDVAVSARKKFEGNPDKITRQTIADRSSPSSWAMRLGRLRDALQSTWRKLRRQDRAGLDFVYWLPDLVAQLLTLLGIRRRSVWGPRIPGLRALLRSHTTLEVAALQWRTSVEQVLNYRAAHPELPYFLIRYEELCRSPRETAEKIYAFCELDPPENLDDVLASIIRTEAPAHEVELTPAERASLHELIGDTLLRLGYQL